ncbi:MAG: hypothetical protein IT376_08615 [Polyangiaceae bacterium]|nr:hypothetical protein [Polyangiaceae bacterium]
MSERRARRLALAAWVVVIASFCLFASRFATRLTNTFFGDVEFTGWSNPLAHRLLAGDRPWVDFFLPIPPGSFVVLAWVERVVGRRLLLNELGLNIACHLVMGLLAYAGTVRLTTRTNALLVAVSTLAVVVQLNKEIAYDHTAQVVAWASLVVGVHGLRSTAPRAAPRLWFAAGALAGFTHFFKQSTGLGVVLGWGVGLVVLAVLARLRGERLERRPAIAWAAGLAVGLAATLAGVAALGGSIPAFLQAVYRDGPALKGGTLHLARVMLNYVVGLPSFPGSFVIVALLAWVGVRLWRHQGLEVGAEPERDEPLGVRAAAGAAALAVVGFGGAYLALGSGAEQLPRVALAWSDALKLSPSLGLPFATLFALVHLGGAAARGRSTAAAADLAVGRARAGDTFVVLYVAALVCSLLHNTSAPEFRAFYDNNPIVFVALAFLFVALDRARLGSVKWVAAALCVAGLACNKLDRAMAATYPLGAEGYWAHLQVGPRARGLWEAAAVVRRTLPPTETALVLPDDLALAPLLERPRPPLRGAVVFVDQYPEHVLAHDLELLRREPPGAIVLDPAERVIWMQLYRTWAQSSPAERLNLVVLDELLSRYRKVDSRPTRFLVIPTTLEVWVRADLLPPAASR